MILRRSSAAACRPKSARRVRVGVERRVSLARHRDVGTQHLKTTPTAALRPRRGGGGRTFRAMPRMYLKYVFVRALIAHYFRSRA